MEGWRGESSASNGFFFSKSVGSMMWSNLIGPPPSTLVIDSAASLVYLFFFLFIQQPTFNLEQKISLSGIGHPNRYLLAAAIVFWDDFNLLPTSTISQPP